MKLKNKKTGKIVTAETYRCGGNCSIELVFAEEDQPPCEYNSLAELCEEWTDYEKPEELYIVDARHECCVGILNIEENPEWCARLVELGLGFNPKEEAEKAKFSVLADFVKDLETKADFNRAIGAMESIFNAYQKLRGIKTDDDAIAEPEFMLHEKEG